MEIEFLKVGESPTDVATSSARTCYSGKGLVLPIESAEWKRKPELLISLLKSGHHTVFQHSHITMKISGISRHLIWRLLHSHNFYSSEQVSQRYAKVSEDSFYYPTAEWKEFYLERFREYEKLSELLEKPIREVLPKFQKKSAKKKAMEIARYVLPQGVTAYMYHTVNLITLFRYISVSQDFPEATKEAKEFGELLEKRVLELDSDLKSLVEFVKREKWEFPEVNLEGDEVYDIVGNLDFQISANYGGVLRSSQLLHDSGMVGGFSSKSKISLSADAQNQRHRRSLGVRPLLEKDFREEFYIPKILSGEILDFYLEAHQKIYKFFKSQVAKIGFEEAIYALPNSHLISVFERTDWSSYHHKAQMRLCYNAQEEIFDMTYRQVEILREKDISGSEKLLPPCGVRAELGIHPICPEGERYCGIKVWKLDFEEYSRKI